MTVFTLLNLLQVANTLFETLKAVLCFSCFKQGTNLASVSLPVQSLARMPCSPAVRPVFASAALLSLDYRH